MGIHMISAVLGVVFNYKNQSIFAIFAVGYFFQDQTHRIVVIGHHGLNGVHAVLGFSQKLPK